MKGSYILIVELKNDLSLSIGKKGKMKFYKGYYVYIGSAINSLEKRIQRHLRDNKIIHWHIDYLLKYAIITDVFYKESSYKEECKIAKELDKNLMSIKDFGCSDCKCESHLFYGPKDCIKHIINKLEMHRFYNEKT
jgi:Uri superfamily endonuclease